MSMMYRIVGYNNSHDHDIVRDFDTKEEALDLIDEMTKNLGRWKKISFKIFDGFDKAYDSTVWKDPYVKWGDDICYY